MAGHDAVNSLLSYLQWLSKQSASNTKEDKIALTCNEYVSKFVQALAFAPWKSAETHLNIFLRARGPYYLVLPLVSRTPLLRISAQQAVLKISTYVLDFPQEEVCINIFLDLFRATENYYNYGALYQCRNDMVLHLMRRLPPSTSHVCNIFIEELAASCIRQFTIMQQAPRPNINFKKIKHELKNFVIFAKHIRHLGSEVPDNEINKLLNEADDWIQKIDKKDQTFNCSQFFLLLLLMRYLKEADEDDDIVSEKLSALLTQKHAALNTLIQDCAEDGCFSLPVGEIYDDLKSILTFDSRKVLAMRLLPKPEEETHIIISRNKVIEDSFEKFNSIYAHGEDLSGGISIEFVHEVATGPGVLREWFYLVCKELFNPKFGLFIPCPQDKSRFFPNYEGSGNRDYFKFCGQVVALGLMHNVKIDVKLARFFFNQLAKREITWEDAKDADPQLYDSYKNIIEMDPQAVDNLCPTFDIDICINGSLQNIELCPGGRGICLNSNNRLAYVNSHVYKRLAATVYQKAEAFADGFSDALYHGIRISHYLEPLGLEDLDTIMYGRDRIICVQDWKLHTEYNDYTSTDEVINWFWQVVERMTNDDRRKVLFFSTSIQHLPSEGFSGLSTTFKIYKSAADINRLPTAHTCFFQLNLPPYPSYEMMHERLYAITADHLVNGFGIE